MAALPKLLGWCLPLLASRGELLALKGESAEQELVEARKLLRQRHLTGEVIQTPAPGAAETTWVVRIR